MGQIANQMALELFFRLKERDQGETGEGEAEGREVKGRKAEGRVN